MTDTCTREGDTLTIRRFTSEEWELYRDLRLRALLEAPDAFGSTWAHESGRTDTEWRARLSAASSSRRDLPLVAELRGEPAGLAWARMEGAAPTVAHLYQMWVTPKHRGRGVGRALLGAAVEWARAAGAQVIVLDVTVGNGPAGHLYERAGFIPLGAPKPLRPGSTLQSRSLQLFLAGSPGESSSTDS